MSAIITVHDGISNLLGTSGEIALSASGVCALAGGNDITLSLDPLDGHVAKVVAAANVIGGIPVVHMVTVGDVATGDTDVVLTYKTRVTDVVVVKQAAAGDNASNTLTVKNGATAITNAMDMNVADKTVVRAGTIDDAQWDIAAGGTLRLSHVKAGTNSPAYTAFVHGIRVS